MIDLLRNSYTIQFAILFTGIFADFMLALIFALLLNLQKSHGNAEIQKEISEAPETDAERAVREAQEDAEAFRKLQNYGVADAYRMGDSG